MRADGSAQTRLIFEADHLAYGPVFSPDGTLLVYSRYDPQTQVGELYRAGSDGSTPTQITTTGRNNYLVAWSPDGGRLAFISQQGQDVDTAEVATVNADGSDFRILVRNDTQEYGVDWSPDGQRLVFGSERDGTWQLYTMHSDGTDVRLLPSDGGGNAPAWSPDGRSIAFSSDRIGTDQIYVMNADGMDVRRLTQGESHNYVPAWSPDGVRLAFSSDRDGSDQIYVMNADGSNVVNLTRNAALSHTIPSWSPSGRSISYTAVARSADDPSLGQALGIASILLQSALLGGVVLLLSRTGRLPLGALTLLVGLSSVAVVLISDQYGLLPAMLVTGIAADLFYALLLPAPIGPKQLALFAFAFPSALYTFYFLTLSVTAGIGWEVHVWAGAIVGAGLVGLLISTLVGVGHAPAAAAVADGSGGSPTVADQVSGQ